MTDKLDEWPETDGAEHSGRRVLGFFLKLAAILLVAGLAATSLVMVDETEFVIVERLGEIVAVYDRPEQRGLHFGRQHRQGVGVRLLLHVERDALGGLLALLGLLHLLARDRLVLEPHLLLLLLRTTSAA